MTLIDTLYIFLCVNFFAFGPELDLVAPGYLMQTTSMGNLYTYVNGTSFSCAPVSAVVALLSSEYPHLNREEIIAYLALRADDLGEEGRDDTYGYGKVNAFETVLAVATYCEGNFDCDQDQDGTDAVTFKEDYGRNQYVNPCNDLNPCHGDFECDSDVDGTDASLFKSDFGRNSYNTPCPACVVGNWCVY